MRMVSYDNVVFSGEFCGVRDGGGRYERDQFPDYEALLDMLSKDLFKEKYALYLQVRKGYDLIYEFPAVPCPALFLEQLKIRKV